MNGGYFGRNLDLEGSFGEGVVITPRAYRYMFRAAGNRANSYAMIGMAILRDNFPLYYDAVNEYGLGMAGLNFPKNAAYLKPQDGKINLAPFEMIPYILGSCKTVAEAERLLKDVNVADIHFNKELPNTPLHWMISDGTGSIVAEPMQGGLKVYKNPVNVLTNNPPFDVQLKNLDNYAHLTNEEKKDGGDPRYFSRGSGAVGLPGDWSSQSRFVRAVFVTRHILPAQTPLGGVQAFFHALSSVAMPDGCVKLKEGVYEKTVYSCCCDTQNGIYYYTTYSNPQPAAVKLSSVGLDGALPLFRPLKKQPEIIID